MDFARGCKDEHPTQIDRMERVTRQEIRDLYDLPLPD